MNSVGSQEPARTGLPPSTGLLGIQVVSWRTLPCHSSAVFPRPLSDSMDTESLGDMKVLVWNRELSGNCIGVEESLGPWSQVTRREAAS